MPRLLMRSLYRQGRLAPLFLWLWLVPSPEIGSAGISESADPTSPPPLRRVVLISCDTLAAKHLPLYGYDTVTTTTLDSLAAWGVLFERCLAPQGWTLSSHLSLLTGLAPGVHRAGKQTALAGTIPLLSEMLVDAGCTAAAFLGVNQWLAADYGFDRGFDIYRFQDLSEETHNWGFSWLHRSLMAQDAPANRWPFFLFLHFMEPHSRPVEHDYLMPYWAPLGIYHHYLGVPDVPPPIQLLPDGQQWDLAAYNPADLRKAYDACVRYWDQERLRPVLAFLRQNGLLSDTLLIITSDHGEEIAEHGGFLHDSPFVEVREVPLVMVWLGRLPAGLRVKTPVSLLDITPTVLDLANLPQPPVCQGISLRPVLEGTAAEPPARDFLIDGQRRGFELHPTALIARVAGTWWSLVATTDTTQTTGNFLPARVDSLLGLFDLAKDPHETRNLLTSHPDIGQELTERLTAALASEAELAKSVHAEGAVEEVDISEETKRQLRALGY